MSNIFIVVIEIVSIAAITWLTLRLWSRAKPTMTSFELAIATGAAVAIALLVGLGALSETTLVARLAWIVGSTAAALTVIGAMTIRARNLAALRGRVVDAQRRNPDVSRSLRRHRWFRLLGRGRYGP